MSGRQGGVGEQDAATVRALHEVLHDVAPGMSCAWADAAARSLVRGMRRASEGAGRRRRRVAAGSAGVKLTGGAS